MSFGRRGLASTRTVTMASTGRAPIMDRPARTLERPHSAGFYAIALVLWIGAPWVAGHLLYMRDWPAARRWLLTLWLPIASITVGIWLDSTTAWSTVGSPERVPLLLMVVGGFVALFVASIVVTVWWIRDLARLRAMMVEDGHG